MAGEHLSEQLKMFMSPREIRSQYQPLDADRLDTTEWGDLRTRTGTDTRQAAREAIPTRGNTFQAVEMRRMHSNVQHGYRESDSDLWERKAEEAEDSYDPPLQRSIAERGVLNPVQLSTQQMGSQGKQSVIGGHHRIAAAHDVDPDMLIPVLHHPNILAAKHSREYPYEEGYPRTRQYG